MDNLTVEQRRKNMQNIRSTDTKVELLVAKALRKQRIYSARNVKSLIGRPDFVFRRKKVVIFIDSDFWHGHPKRCIMPKSNCEYWVQKIMKNKLRDRAVSRQLKKEGWTVLRIWEYDIKKRFNHSFEMILSSIK